MGRRREGRHLRRDIDYLAAARSADETRNAKLARSLIQIDERKDKTAARLFVSSRENGLIESSLDRTEPDSTRLEEAKL